jgi:hypothetical protein
MPRYGDIVPLLLNCSGESGGLPLHPRPQAWQTLAQVHLPGTLSRTRRHMTQPIATYEASLVETDHSPRPPRRRWPIYGKRWSLKLKLLIVIVVAAAVIVTMVVLSVVPVKQSFNGGGTSYLCGGCGKTPNATYEGHYIISLPSNVNITLNWRAEKSPVEFNICLAGPSPVPANGPGCLPTTTGSSTFCVSYGMSGSCSFSSNVMVYLFFWEGGGAQQISWSGSYTAPYLWWFD